MRIFTILLNYKGLTDTIECLGSLLEYTDTNNHIVIIDNCSPDNSYDKFKSWSLKNLHKKDFQFIDQFSPDKNYDLKRISFIQSGFNGGFAFGNNIGIQFAYKFTPAYIWLLNNDTIITDSTLSAMIHGAKPKRIVGSIIYYYNKPDKIWAWGGGRIRFITGSTRHLYSKGRLDYISGASILIPFNAFNEIGYLDSEYFMYWEDVDFSTRALNAGYTLYVPDNATVYHKVNSSSNNEKSIFIDSHAIIGLIRYSKKFYKSFYIIPIIARITKIIILRIVKFDFKNALSLMTIFLNNVKQ